MLAQLLMKLNVNPGEVWRQGVVTAIVGSTVTVQIGAATTPVAGLRYFTWYSPTVNDVVHLLPYGKSFVVMGKLA